MLHRSLQDCKVTFGQIPDARQASQGLRGGPSAALLQRCAPPILGGWAAWLPGCLAAWLPGCLAAWLPGCLAAWLPGCLAAWQASERTAGGVQERGGVTDWVFSR